jgi:hypothetical protein
MPVIPTRFATARRWEKRAFVFAILYMVSFLGPLFQIAWLPFVMFPIAMPAFWLLNLRCYRCAWLAYKQFGTAPELWAKDQLGASLKARMLYHLPDACTKCGAPFIDTRLDEAQS